MTDGLRPTRYIMKRDWTKADRPVVALLSIIELVGFYFDKRTLMWAPIPGNHYDWNDVELDDITAAEAAAIEALFRDHATATTDTAVKAI